MHACTYVVCITVCVRIAMCMYVCMHVCSPMYKLDDVKKSSILKKWNRDLKSVTT